MLSFNDGKAIAKVLKIKRNKEGFISNSKEMNVIYMKDKNDDDYEKINFKDELDPLLNFDKKFFLKDKRQGRYLNTKQKQSLRKALREDMEPDDIKLMGYFHQAKKEKHNKLNKEIYLDNPELMIVPVPDHKRKGKKIEPKRECLYISAPSGGGKSTYVAFYAMEYKKLFPRNKIYMFSRVNEDPSIDYYIKLKRIIINDNLVENPIEPAELKNSLVIFDDIDTIPDREQRKTVSQIRKDLLQTGRHEDVYVASTSHQITNYLETRDLLTESRGVTFFPQSGDVHHIEYFLKKYGGIRKQEEINKILGLPSRWITLYKSFPMYILHEQGVLLLNNAQVNTTKLRNDPNVFNYNEALETQNYSSTKKQKKYDSPSESENETENETENDSDDSENYHY